MATTNNIWVGVDPGKTGAVALVVPTSSEVRMADTPVLVEAGKKTAYDHQGMRRLLLDFTQGRAVGVLVVIEAQQAMPKQGATSGFTTGMGYGLWLGLLAGLQIPFKIVQPAGWKKRLMDGEPRTAQASVAVALRHYPTLRDQLVGPKGGLKDGRADALLLAHYGRLFFSGS